MGGVRANDLAPTVEKRAQKYELVGANFLGVDGGQKWRETV